MTTQLWYWIIFTITVMIMLGIDLWFTDHRKTKLGIKRALLWSAIWISVALLYNISIYFKFPNGHIKAMEFLAAYLIEKSLSVDNLFVFIMIFTIMGIEDRDQPHILKWGILGAIFFRVVFILAGVALIQKFDFVIYIFGLALIYTSYKMAFTEEKKIEPEKNFFVKVASKFFPVKTNNVHRFFVKEKGKIYITNLFLTLLLIESTDIVFAIDSIPAVLAISRDPFIVITSNIFAILGLRALYFALAGIMSLFRYLKYGIAFLLFFVGIKMLISEFHHVPVYVSLIVITVTLTVSILASKFSETKNDDINN